MNDFVVSLSNFNHCFLEMGPVISTVTPKNRTRHFPEYLVWIDDRLLRATISK